MEDEKREIRCIAEPVTLREAEESRTVEGYAAVFDRSSDRLDFEEVIERNAFDGVIEKSDVMALLNHDIRRGLLARSTNGKGTLTLTVDAKGLRYSFEAPKFAAGDELVENVRRGDVQESSFAFTVEKDTWEKKDDGTWKRTIHKIARLYDVSPVYNAAYSQTSVYMRGKELAEKELEERNRVPDSYYENLKTKYNV
jgi:HK97 family phage prohead protease